MLTCFMASLAFMGASRRALRANKALKIHIDDLIKCHDDIADLKAIWDARLTMDRKNLGYVNITSPQ